MLGSLNRAIGGKSKYEKVTTLDEPMGVFAIEEDDDIERISQLHRDLVTQAQAELQESEEILLRQNVCDIVIAIWIAAVRHAIRAVCWQRVIAWRGLSSLGSGLRGLSHVGHM